MEITLNLLSSLPLSPATTNTTQRIRSVWPNWWEAAPTAAVINRFISCFVSSSENEKNIATKMSFCYKKFHFLRTQSPTSHQNWILWKVKGQISIENFKYENLQKIVSNSLLKFYYTYNTMARQSFVCWPRRDKLFCSKRTTYIAG